MSFIFSDRTNKSHTFHGGVCIFSTSHTEHAEVGNDFITTWKLLLTGHQERNIKPCWRRVSTATKMKKFFSSVSQLQFRDHNIHCWTFTSDGSNRFYRLHPYLLLRRTRWPPYWRVRLLCCCTRPPSPQTAWEEGRFHPCTYTWWSLLTSPSFPSKLVSHWREMLRCNQTHLRSGTLQKPAERKTDPVRTRRSGCWGRGLFISVAYRTVKMFRAFRQAVMERRDMRKWLVE